METEPDVLWVIVIICIFYKGDNMLKNKLSISGKMKKIKIFFTPLLILSIFLLFFLFSCSNKNEIESVNFETLSKDFYSQQVQEENYVVKDPESLNQLLDLIGNTNLAVTVEDIDFSEDMVVAVFMGEKPTGGYSIEIKDVLNKKDHIEFLIKIDEPGPDDMVAQVITSPYHIIKLERFDTDYLFTFVD